MSTAKAQREILSRLKGTGTILCAVLLHLDDDTPPAWADGVDALGRAVVLVGRKNLGAAPEATSVVEHVLAALAGGNVPSGVLPIVYRPRASHAIADVVDAAGAHEILLDGPRGSGKTQAIPGALAILAELHWRSRHAIPLRVLWLHDLQVNASMKTGRSLELPMWGGLWRLQDDRRQAVLTVGGREMIHADFVGTRDESSAERLRTECHVLAAEELVPSLSESGGIEERKYELGLTSMRLATRRAVAVSTTNPGSKDTWPFRRFITPGRVGCRRHAVPATDRLTAIDVARLRDAFRDSPDLERRLALGEWSELILGETVAVGFMDDHILPHIEVIHGAPLMFGIDASGLRPATIIGQPVGGGGLNILASLASERAGAREHLEAEVLPWLAVKAPGAERIIFYDPAMDGTQQSDAIRDVLGGVCCPGAVKWQARRDPLLTLLMRRNIQTGKPAFQISAVGCELLISALRSRWYYPTVDGVTSRELPVKNHPWSDLGDGLCYLVGGAVPMASPWTNAEPLKVETTFDPREMFSPSGSGGGV